jgi:hypothetical protein
MSDYLATYADHLNRAPSPCICGHPSGLHDIDGGCCAYDPDAVGMFCLCEEGR